MSGRNESIARLRDNMNAKGKDGRETNRERHPTMALRLEYENGDQKGVLYGELLGGPYYNPSHGIQLVFEGAHAKSWDTWEYGCWQVSITGSNLEGIYWGLCESKQSYVRVGENEPEDGGAKDAEKPSVTEIAVIVANIKGYPPVKK